MTQPKNVFNSPLTAALDGLADLSVASVATRAAIKAANNATKSDIEAFDRLMAKHNKRDDYFLGVTLTVPDYFRSKEWLKSRAHRPRAIIREGIIHLNDEIADRLRSLFVCAGFELLEDYLHEVAAQCYFRLRREQSKARLKLPFNKKKFHSRNPKLYSDGSENTVPYFRKYVSFAYRNGLSDFLRQLSANLQLSAKKPGYAMQMNELTDRYRLIEYCRHVTVHEFGRYDGDTLKHLNRWYKPDRLSRFSGLTKHRTIIFDHEVANHFLTMMAGIAYHVYLGVSDAFEMPDDFFGMDNA